MGRLRGMIGCVLALGVAACESGPEVVARSSRSSNEGDGGPLEAGLFHQPPHAPATCVAGKYRGQFDSAREDGGPPVQIGGDISFEIGLRGNEFKILDPNSELSGKDDATESAFHARVVAMTACVDGAFAATLEDGQYFRGGFGPIPFTGDVKGKYYDEWKSFVGTWTTYLPGGTDPIATGWWDAHLMQ